MIPESKELKFDRDYVTYEDFGAVGDGKSEDFGAIYKAHEYANAHGLTVKGTPGKTYYINDTKLGTDKVHVATIKTNVDWCGANFIIDDTNLTVRKDMYDLRVVALKPIFSVEPEEEHKKFKIDAPEILSKITAEGLNQKTKKIDLGIDSLGPVMIIPYNSAHGVFRRRGYTQYEGEPMHEIIILDKDGNVSEETPIMFSYASLDYIDVYKLDPSTAITVENGVFTTLESRINLNDKKEDGTYDYLVQGYIFRGLSVTRSYTTVKNIEHIVTGGFTLLERVEQNLEGPMYHGFFRAATANEITFKDCIMPGRTAPGPGYGHSSYNFGALYVNKIVLDGCVQPNFWVTVDPETYEVKNATKYDKNAIGHAVKTSKDARVGMGTVNVKGKQEGFFWGIGGTNYCKNMEYRNSTLTRFDAHAGLYNGKVVNCNISALELTGYGDFEFSDCNWYQYSDITAILDLRSDYGYHWQGDILVKNINAYALDSEKLFLARHYFNNWYYGYTCSIPNITLDNVRYFNQVSEEPIKHGFKVHLFRFTRGSERMHLDNAGIPGIFAVSDKDGDGFIDEPRFISEVDGTFLPQTDLDGDGKIGNTYLRYADYIVNPRYKAGAVHPTCLANLNKTRPPKYFKVINNKDENGEFFASYIVKDTSDINVSDGGWYRDMDSPDTMGGFFGGTKFIYGDGHDDYVIGTADKQNVGGGITFLNEYDPLPF